MTERQCEMGQARARFANGGRNEHPSRLIWASALTVVALLSLVLDAEIGRAADETTGLSTHEVTWLHQVPAEVRSFTLYVSPVKGSLEQARQINVGKPGGSNSQSAVIFSALVSIRPNDFVAVSAVGRNGLESAPSAWRRPQPSQPGQPLVVDEP